MMKKPQRLAAIERLLAEKGLDKESAREAADEAVANDEPLLESLCFQCLAEHLLARIHSSSWIRSRASESSGDGHDVIRRLLDSGAAADDLALFARMMQREYLSNLGCILDEAGIVGMPDLPCNEYRVFHVDDAGKPLVRLDELHESLGWTDVDTEMGLSRAAEERGRRPRK
jgi:hypothetical protein